MFAEIFVHAVAEKSQTKPTQACAANAQQKIKEHFKESAMRAGRSFTTKTTEQSCASHARGREKYALIAEL